MERTKSAGTSCWSAYDVRVLKWDGSSYKRVWSKYLGWTEARVGDLDGDEKNEILTVSGCRCGGATTPQPTARVFRYEGGEFKEIWRKDLATTGEYSAFPEPFIGNLVGSGIPEFAFKVRSPDKTTVKIFGFDEFRGEFAQVTEIEFNSSFGDMRLFIGDSDNNGVNELIVSGLHDEKLRIYEFVAVYEHLSPIAYFTYSTSGLTVEFNASLSYDPDGGDIVLYTWDFEDGNITNTTHEIIKHSYSEADIYEVTLTVTDNEGAKNSTTKIITVYSGAIFDTGSSRNPYPSIMGVHKGTIKPNHTIIATRLYTYACAGTGGHTEYARIWNKTWNATATWEGYAGDWHNITFDNPVVLLANKTYNYTIRTGSYPQIHHNRTLTVPDGEITCTKFIDANGGFITTGYPLLNYPDSYANRLLSHWAYRHALSRLAMLCEENRVQIAEMEPRGTSKACARCESGENMCPKAT